MTKNQNNPFEDSALTTILVVSEMARSKAFYVDVLGADIFREYGGDSLVLEFLGNWILLVTPGGPTADKPNTHFVPISDKDAVSHSYTIRVKDCVQSYEILKNRGAEFLTPPVVNGAETRCFFRDPDGHLFEISEYRAS
jgi:catechol 2,3-dioxygenase-like lactoylglutathione lyase family enzyme